MPATQCGAATLPSHPWHALPGMLVAILAVCSLETLLQQRNHRQGREAWITFSILGRKSVDIRGLNSMGKAFRKCILSKRCYVALESVFKRGRLQMFRKEFSIMQGSTKNLEETCPSRGRKYFNWFMQRVTTGRDLSHKKNKQMVRDRRQKQKVWQVRQLVGPVVRMASCPEFGGLDLHLL